MAQLSGHTDLRMTSYIKSTAKVAVLMGRVNFLWYRKRFPSSITIAMGQAKYYVRRAYFCIELNDDCSIRRLVFFSYHPVAEFYYMNDRVAEWHDTL